MNPELIIRKSNRNIKLLVVILIIVLVGTFTIGANAQAPSIYSVSRQIQGTYLTGKDYQFKTIKSDTFTVVLNENKHYQVAFEGKECQFEYEGVTFDGDFKIIDIYTTDKVTVTFIITPKNKKTSASIVLGYVY